MGDRLTPMDASVAVIGGSGFYSFLDDPQEIHLDTPYGEPSGPVHVGRMVDETGESSEATMAFLPRHGADHRFPPHRINYRANLWALRSLGVRQVIAPCAVGGLQPELRPGDLVVPDQLVDRTSARVQSFVESGAVHAPFADPYCGRLRDAMTSGDAVHDGGAMVVIEGPRFSTRAESQHYAAQGWSLINMTGHPEAVLARELGMCYAAIALVTDLDAGIEAGSGVTQQDVFAVFAKNIDRLKKLMAQWLPRLPDPEGCDCDAWADGVQRDYLP